MPRHFSLQPFHAMHHDNLLETIIHLYPQELNYSWLLFYMFVCMLWLIGFYVIEEADEERRMAQSLEEQEQAADAPGGAVTKEA
jgi:hypothetical protein